MVQNTASIGIELLAVAVIVGPVAFGSVHFLLALSRRATDPYSAYKDLIGRSLLRARIPGGRADVIRTVALELTPRNIGMVGALVVIRTFLSWSVVVETERHWPWQPQFNHKKSSETEVFISRTLSTSYR